MIRRAAHIAAASVLCVAYWAAFVLAAPLFFGGCVYKGAKVTEGTDLTLGVSLPAASGVAETAVVNRLTGFRLAVAENSRLKVKYMVAETNSWFGCIYTHTHKAIDATVEPCESDPPPDGEKKGD